MNEFNSCRSKRASIINYSKIWLDTFGASINRGRRRSSVSTSLFKAKDPIITDYSKSEDFDKIHKHDHSSKPHIHDSNNLRCSSSSSGFDSHRLKRYYFTTEKTPCRVYIVYGGNALALSSIEESEQGKIAKSDTREIFRDEYRKLTASELKKINLSPKFHKDALNMIYCRNSRSIIPLPPLIRSSSRTKSRTPTNT